MLADPVSEPQGLSSRTKASELCAHHPGLALRMGLGVQQVLGSQTTHELREWGEQAKGQVEPGEPVSASQSGSG